MFVRTRVALYSVFHPVNVLVAFGSNPFTGSLTWSGIIGYPTVPTACEDEPGSDQTWLYGGRLVDLESQVTVPGCEPPALHLLT